MIQAKGSKGEVMSPIYNQCNEEIPEKMYLFGRFSISEEEKSSNKGDINPIVREELLFRGHMAIS